MGTNWENLVSGEELKKIKTRRAKTFITSKERRSALPELIDEGWEFVKDYKDPKYVSVKMDKPHDEQFEDRVWTLFANMGFTTMSKDRHFVMAHDNNHTQQIDVFAADDETILIIECKSAEKITTGHNFKKDIEALHGQTEGIRKEIKSQPQFRNHKIKFIWATNNYILSQADVDRLNDWKIALFDESVINYYYELLKHLGSAAKYQLLGSLFANDPIKNMDSRVPAIQGKMGNHTYYSFLIKPEMLLKIGYVLHHNTNDESLMPSYQRIIKKKRLLEIRDFVNKGGYFPNSVIISIDNDGKKIRFDEGTPKVEGALSKIGILHLPPKYRSAYIIDGQHRLYGYSDSKYAASNTIPVVAFVDLDKAEQVQLFMDINENQKPVPKTLRVVLNSDLLWKSEDHNERRQALRSKIAQSLGENPASPLKGRVLIGEVDETPTRCITVEALQAALKKCHFFSTFEKKTKPTSIGSFDTGDNDTTFKLFYPFIQECLIFVHENTKTEWEKGKSNNGILTINRGMQAVIRIIDDIVMMLCAQNKIHPLTDKTSYLVSEVTYYLKPLCSFLEALPESKRDDLRIYGGGADKTYWRTFQQIIAETHSEFQPEGLNEWIQDATKLYNEEAFRMLEEIQIHVKTTTWDKLDELHGGKWKTAVPKEILFRLQQEATAHDYDNMESGLDLPEAHPWDYATLEDIQKIITYSHWQDTFSNLFGDPFVKGNMKERTKWLSTLSSINKKRSRSSYSVPQQEYELVRQYYEWLIVK